MLNQFKRQEIESTELGTLYFDYQLRLLKNVFLICTYKEGTKRYIYCKDAPEFISAFGNEVDVFVKEYLNLFKHERSIMEEMDFKCAGYGMYNYQGLKLMENGAFLYDGKIARTFVLSPFYSETEMYSIFNTLMEALFKLCEGHFELLPSKARDMYFKERLK